MQNDATYQKTKNWLFQLFTQHPYEAGETFFEHWAFTMQMSVRFLYVSAVIFLHGLFPFLLKREGSRQIEKIYKIMKTRAPKNNLPDGCIHYDI